LAQALQVFTDSGVSFLSHLMKPFTFRSVKKTPSALLLCLAAFAATGEAGRLGRAAPNSGRDAALGGSCSWSIHYNKWLPDFAPGEFEHNEPYVGAHCLEACCNDPGCIGLQIESSLESQCYKYDQLPDELSDSEPSQSLVDFLKNEKRPAWSVLLKGPAVASTNGQPPPSPEYLDQLAAKDLPSANAATQEADLDVKLRGALEPKHKCEWDVHYDKWIPTFVNGEYEGSGPEGGAHCLEICCQDPSCLGLSLESNEKFQCYRYSVVPPSMTTSGQALGDGAWLRAKNPAWSVFVKRVVPLQPVSPSTQPPVSVQLLTPKPLQKQQQQQHQQQSQPAASSQPFFRNLTRWGQHHGQHAVGALSPGPANDNSWLPSHILFLIVLFLSVAVVRCLSLEKRQPLGLLFAKNVVGGGEASQLLTGIEVPAKKPDL